MITATAEVHSGVPGVDSRGVDTRRADVRGVDTSTADTPLRAHTVLLIGIAALCATGWGIESAWPWHLRAVLCPVAALSVALAVSSQQWRTHLSVEPLLILVLVALPASAWVAGADENARRVSLAVVGATVACALVASVVPGGQLLRGIAAVLGVVVVAVLVHAALDPRAAYAPAPGEPESLGLRSFFWQKNSLGLTLALAAAVSVVIERTATRWALRGLIVVALLLSRSSTALVATVAVLVVQQLLVQIASGRRAGRHGATFLVITTGVALVAVVLGLRGRLLGVLGKGSDLTGRDEIWAGTWAAAQDRLLFGHGFGVFWSVDSPQRAALRRLVGWNVAGPHQGVLEVITELGLFGLVLFVALVMVVGARLAGRVMDGSVTRSHLAGAGLLLAVIVSSVSEATLVVPGLPIIGLVSGMLLNEHLVATTRHGTPHATSHGTADIR